MKCLLTPAIKSDKLNIFPDRVIFNQIKINFSETFVRDSLLGKYLRDD